MDDFVYLDWMKNAYEVNEQNTRSIDSKAYSMVGIIGAILTIQSSFLLNLVPTTSTKYLFVVSLIAYFVSILFFVLCVLNRKYAFYPTAKAVEHVYCEDVSDERFISGFMGDYKNVINHNFDILLKKSKLLFLGFVSFIFGLVFLLLFILCVLI